MTLRGERALLLACCLFGVVLLVPWQPVSLSKNPDSAWQNVLHDAFATHAHFGDEIVFTFGPWGFVYIGYDPRTFAAMLAVRFAIALATMIALFEIARLTLPTAWQRAGLLLLVPPLLALDIGSFHDIPFLFVPFLLLRAHFAGARRPVIAIVAAALGLIALTKFSFVFAVAAAVGVVSLDDAWKRRFPVALFTSASSALFFWMLAKQPLANVIPFVRSSIEVANGYSENMSLTFGYVSDDVALAMTAVLMLAVIVRSRPALYALGTAGVLFLAFKAGAVRIDGHDLISHTTLAAVAIVAAPRNRKMLLPMIASVALLAYSIEARNFPRLGERLGEVIAQQTRDACRLARRRTRDLDQDYAARMAKIRSHTTRPLAAACDVYPVISDLPMAWNVLSARRPVFQSYSAYTPRLQELNAAWLRSRRAPQTILFEIYPMDHRLPSTEDGASWPELLTRYDVTGTNGEFLVLERRATPAPLPRTFVFARLEMAPTLAGRLLTTLVRAPAVHVALTTASGRHLRFRIAPGSARAPFLLSPLITTNEEFASRSGERVTSIAVERERDSWFWKTPKLVLVRF